MFVTVATKIILLLNRCLLSRFLTSSTCVIEAFKIASLTIAICHNSRSERQGTVCLVHREVVVAFLKMHTPRVQRLNVKHACKFYKVHTTFKSIRGTKVNPFGGLTILVIFFGKSVFVIKRVLGRVSGNSFINRYWFLQLLRAFPTLLQSFSYKSVLEVIWILSVCTKLVTHCLTVIYYQVLIHQQAVSISSYLPGPGLLSAHAMAR